ncbi:MAG: YbaB/EbfC family nucleoid-associated protein, partial [Alphaproteobacteria bacterium]|nr:YbaB/EbfC family nucleoid-associated protein [Alphaproteobacteria bacterium]
MKDLTDLMKQAQAMQQKLQEAQARMAETTAEGTSGGGLVTLSLKGAGEITRIAIDDTLMQPGESEILADLIVAAHAEFNAAVGPLGDGEHKTMVRRFAAGDPIAGRGEVQNQPAAVRAGHLGRCGQDRVAVLPAPAPGHLPGPAGRGLVPVHTGGVPARGHGP